MKNSKELIKAGNMLSIDRLSISESFGLLISSDIKNLMSDYFEICNNPIVNVKRNGSKLNVCINFEAFQVKKFISVK